MLLEKLDQMVEVQNLILDRLQIKNACEGLALATRDEMTVCAHCSNFELLEMDCPVMTVYGQGAVSHDDPDQPGLASYPMQEN